MKDIKGQKFGYLEVLSLAAKPDTTQRCAFWLCRCICGETITVRGTQLRNQHSKSCGCGGLDRTPIDNGDGSVSLPLLHDKFVVFDKTDLAKVLKYRWRAVHHGRRHWYARTSCTTGHISMHVFLMGAVPGMQVDHIDGDGLNNRRNNLRFSTPAQNGANQRPRIKARTKFKGIHFTANGWQVTVRGKYAGRFKDEIEAAKAYDTKAIEIWGEFAKLNFPKV